MSIDPKILAIILAVILLAVSGGDIPTPPGPTPPTPDVDPTPAVITADGPHVLVVEETADRGRLPTGQLTALFMIGGWCRVNGVEFRAWDDEIDNQEQDPFWGKALQLAETTPWIVIANDTEGYSGPFPSDWDACKELLEEYN